MPKYSEKFLNDRNKIYQENNKLLDMLYAVYRGNFIQGQAKEICFHYDYKREIKKGEEIQLVSYTDNTFNNLFRKLEELNLIDRKKYKDTNNLCVSFKKGLISMILNIPQDKISANKNAMNNSTNEVFSLSLFKGYVLLNYYSKFASLKNCNYNEILDLFKRYNTHIFLSDNDIFNLYKWIEGISEDVYNDISRKTDIIYKKVNNIENVREMKKAYNDNEIYNTYKGELSSKHDLISLKRGKIYINAIQYNKDNDIMVFAVDICILNAKYNYQKIHSDIKKTVAIIWSLLKYYRKKYRLLINIVGYNKDKMNHFEEEFKRTRKYTANNGIHYLSDKKRIINKNGNGYNKIDFVFCYKDFGKYMGTGFTIQ